MALVKVGPMEANVFIALVLVARFTENTPVQTATKPQKQTLAHVLTAKTKRSKNRKPPHPHDECGGSTLATKL